MRQRIFLDKFITTKHHKKDSTLRIRNDERMQPDDMMPTSKMTSNDPTFKYLRYSSNVETPFPDEEQLGNEILTSMMRQLRNTSDRHRHAHRGTHSKSHAFLKGKLEVYDNLPSELRQGLFKEPKSYPVIIRLASILGEIAPDTIKTQRGFTWKVLGVDGEKLPGHEGQTTQDFLMDNGKTFPVANIKSFLSFQKLQEATVEKAQHLKAALSTVQTGVSNALKSVGVDKAIVDFIGHSPVHILGDFYTTQGAVRYGDYVAKIMVRPLSENLVALKDVKHDLSKSFSPLKEDIAEFFKANKGIYEVCVQLCTNLETMPVEDLTVEWPAAESPYLPVGRIIIDPQNTYSNERRAYGDDVLSFSPGHSLEDHRPLGSIMRARLKVYPQASEFRHKYNSKPKREPRSIDELPE